ncbi:MAG: class I fructose-bisphosphate aldolase [Bacillota bacterium]
MTGKEVRLRRIFRGGRSFISALDYGGFMGPAPGIDDPRAIVRQVVDGGADAILANPGIARSEWATYAGRCGLIVRLTGGATRYSPDMSYHTLVCSVEQAVALGADAVCIMVLVGAGEEQLMFENMAKVTSEASRLGLPVLAEVIPADMNMNHDPECIAVCARVGYELGADFIKTYYTGAGFERIVRACNVPVVIAGGPRATDPVTMAKEAIAAGASGIAFGRNVFQAPDPEAMARELRNVVHGEGREEVALR